MNEEDQLEDFLLPVERANQVVKDEMISGGVMPVDSPTRRLGTILNVQASKVPESPDMRFARKRLGNLLTTIKQHPAESLLSDEYGIRQDSEPVDSKSQAKVGRPKKHKDDPSEMSADDSKIIFDLRGKPFELVIGRSDCEYTLCRAWVSGTMEYELSPRNTLRTEYAPNLAVEYLACREIRRMPRPSPIAVDVPVLPPKRDVFDKTVDPTKIGSLKVEYARHWKKVKRDWLAHERIKAARHAKSIMLLEKIFVPPELIARE